MKRLDRSLGRFTVQQFKDFFPWYLGAIICLIATHQIQSYLPFLAKKIGDLVEANQLASLNFSQFFLLALGIVLFRTLSRLLFFYPARKLEVYLRTEFMEKLESAHPSRYVDEAKGQVFQYVYNDVSQIRALIGFAFLQIANVFISFSIIIPKIVQFNPSLLIGFIPLCVCTLIFYSIVSRLRFYFRKTMDLQGDVQNILIESYNGKKTIKNFQSEPAFLKLFNDKSLQELEHFYQAGKGNAFAIPLVRLGVGLSLITGAFLIRAQGLPNTTFLLYSGFVFLLLEPLAFISWIGIVVSRSSTSWERIKEFWAKLNNQSSYEKTFSAKNSYEDKGESITIDTHLWDKNISIELPIGKWTGLVGDTGVGKTFVLENLLNVISNQGKSVAYVSQEPYIFNDTLERNIFLGREASTEEKEFVKKLIKYFELETLEQKTADIFSLELGENGKQVSGGQAKRICLMRTIMSDADFLLWDDPFSSVDVVLERLIIDKLKSSGVLKNKTIVMTTHRLSSFKACDFGVYLNMEAAIEKSLVTDLLTLGKRTYEHFKEQMV